jgi:hypothetical protein
MDWFIVFKGPDRKVIKQLIFKNNEDALRYFICNQLLMKDKGITLVFMHGTINTSLPYEYFEEEKQDGYDGK